ncbi:MAG: molybdenum ABC transporter ATP-binding protein [Candidatus Dadabacteria bacterium]
MLSVKTKKGIKSNGRIAIVLDIEFNAHKEITVLFGPSGSGKTTILYMIAGIVTPDEGKISLGKQIYFDSTNRINLPLQNRRVGFVFQDYSLFPHLTVEQNISYGVNVNTDRAKCRKAREILSLFRIEHLAGQYPRELSGGEQQRVALARALASDPAILLLDEPLSAVDIATRSYLLEEIISIQRRSGVPLIYVTHNSAEAVRIGDYILILSNGRIAQEGKPLEVFNTPQSLEVARVVGTENILMGRVLEHRASEGITTIDLKGCQLMVPYKALPLGTQVTVGINSEDIIVSREHLTQTSARNVLEGRVKSIIRDTEKTELVVGCGVDFKVSLTAGAIETLGLQPGIQVYLLIKARACYLLS